MIAFFLRLRRCAHSRASWASSTSQCACAREPLPPFHGEGRSRVSASGWGLPGWPGLGGGPTLSASPSRSLPMKGREAVFHSSSLIRTGHAATTSAPRRGRTAPSGTARNGRRSRPRRGNSRARAAALVTPPLALQPLGTFGAPHTMGEASPAEEHRRIVRHRARPPRSPSGRRSRRKGRGRSRSQSLPPIPWAAAASGGRRTSARSGRWLG